MGANKKQGTLLPGEQTMQAILLLVRSAVSCSSECMYFWQLVDRYTLKSWKHRELEAQLDWGT
jgi:hypothetical protein